MSAPTPSRSYAKEEAALYQANIIRRSLREETARTAYSAYAGAASLPTPWEKLAPKEMEAWRALIDYLMIEVDCDTCGESLLCLTCDAEAVYTCAECHDHPVLVCPTCGYRPEVPASKSPTPIDQQEVHHEPR